MKKIIFVFLVLFSTNASSFFVQGNQLITWLESEERVDKGSREPTDKYNATQLLGFMQGTIDTGNQQYFCLKENVTLGQAIKIVHKYIKNNPENTHEPAALLVVVALEKAFPCSSKKQGN